MSICTKKKKEHCFRSVESFFMKYLHPLTPYEAVSSLWLHVSIRKSHPNGTQPSCSNGCIYIYVYVSEPFVSSLILPFYLFYRFYAHRIPLLYRKGERKVCVNGKFPVSGRYTARKLISSRENTRCNNSDCIGVLCALNFNNLFRCLSLKGSVWGETSVNCLFCLGKS